MSETPSSAPRRALAPAHSDPPHIEPGPDDTLPRARRLANPDTPIPPPAPVLPTHDPAPTARGRRYSADEPLPEDESPLPRRSALTPGSPASPAASEPLAAAAAPAPKRVLALVAGIVAVVALVAVLALFLVPRPGTPAPAPSPTPTVDRATLLAEPNDLAPLRQGATWTIATDATAVDANTPQPKCLAAASDTAPKAQNVRVRTLAGTPDAGAVLHELDHYATPEEAAQAFDARVTQLGGCPRTTAWLTEYATIGGVADAAAVGSFLLQEAVGEYHVVMLSRSGTDVTILDLAGKEPWTREAAVATLTALAQRQCAATGGACPTTPQVGPQVPPAVAPAGWLASVDLPRLTGGAGTWRGTDIAPMKLTGSACEAIDLTAVAGATASAQRTYLLYDDSRANAVGIDQAIYTFGTPQDATALVGKLAANFDGCQARTATATVRRVGDVTALGGGTGASWFVTQKVTADQTAQFRVSVMAVGPRVVYVFANPSGVDFSDADWQAVATRAAGRITQLP